MNKKPVDIKENLEKLIPPMEEIISDLANRRLDVNKDDIEEKFMADMLYDQEQKLREIVWAIEYLNSQPGPAGILHHNADGRYELPNGDYFTSGEPIEIKVFDDYDECFIWVKTRIEYNHQKQDYYAVSMPDLCLNGVTARRRKEMPKWSRDW